MTRFIMFLAVAVTFCNLAFAETSLKPYSPFDEAKPRIPKEITEDKRLDMKVNVFVKSKNLRDLFAEITEQTGVKLTPSRELAAERAIIYFHARPLRDVMIEVSGLFGYYWLPKGKEGAYSYELIEDSRHAKHRNDLRQAQKDAEEELIVKLAEVCADSTNDETLAKLLQDKPGKFEYVAGESGKHLAGLYSKLGKDFVHRMLNDEPISFSFSDLSPDIQAIILDWNEATAARLAEQQDPGIKPLTTEDVSNATIKFDRMSSGAFRMPTLGLSISAGMHTMIAGWPLVLDEGDIRAVTGIDPLPEKLTGDKLPDEPAITAAAKRKDHRFGSGGGLLPHVGDILQAVAEQSGKDIIADYYFQEMYPKPANKEPLGMLAKALCEKLDYSGQVEGPTLRFRFNKWYLQPLMEEPPARLLEAWWQKITSLGRLEFQDLIATVSLPGSQRSWPGLKFMPGVDYALRSPGSWSIWDSFGKDLEAKAQTGEGLPVSQLSRDQFDQLAAWIKLSPWVEPDMDLSAATIRVTTSQVNEVTTGTGLPIGQVPDQIMLLGWLGRTYQFRQSTTPLSEQERNEAIAQRKADAEADKVELAQ